MTAAKQYFAAVFFTFMLEYYLCIDMYQQMAHFYAHINILN